MVFSSLFFVFFFPYLVQNNTDTILVFIENAPRRFGYSGHAPRAGTAGFALSFSSDSAKSTKNREKIVKKHLTSREAYGIVTPN